MAKFRLLLGMHVQADPKWKPSEEDKEFAKLRGTKPKAPSVTYTAGQVVESETDLVARFGNEKFQLLSGSPKKEKELKEVNTAKPGTYANQPEETTRNLDNPGTGAGGGATSPRLQVDSEYEEDEGDNGEDEKDVDFSHMTIKQLQEYADENEVDVKGAKTKDELVKAMSKKKK